MDNVEQVLVHIRETDVVLDVGGWACPFNRANWIIDAEPYETRGYYAKIGMPAFQGGEKEFFTKDTWLQRDICDKSPWPFPDNFFDFSICSHTLEDIRDPLFVCSELMRVSKRGYIEVPSRLIETCRGCETSKMAGLSHHRWLVEIINNHIQFTMKYHLINSDFRLSFPESFKSKLNPKDKISSIFWENSFTFSETQIHGSDHIFEHLHKYVEDRYRYPSYLLFLNSFNFFINRFYKGIQRRLNFNTKSA